MYQFSSYILHHIILYTYYIIDNMEVFIIFHIIGNSEEKNWVCLKIIKNNKSLEPSFVRHVDNPISRDILGLSMEPMKVKSNKTLFSLCYTICMK